MDYKRTQMLFKGLTGHAASITLIDAKGSTHAVASGMMGPSNLYLSPARPKTTKSVRAKITNAVATLRHTLEGRIIAFEGKQECTSKRRISVLYSQKRIWSSAC